MTATRGDCPTTSYFPKPARPLTRTAQPRRQGDGHRGRSKAPLTPQRKRIYLSVLVLISCAYLVWRLGYTLPLHHGLVSAIFGIALVVAELTAIVEAIIHVSHLAQGAVPQRPDIPRSLYPDVDILIATHNEDTDLLFKTVNGCLFLEYPDPDKVHIYLCDDSNRPAVRQLAEELGVGYFGLSDNKFAKAGNLNHALAHTSSPLVATLDADMIPTRRFLMEAVPYFSLPDMVQENGVWRRRRDDEPKLRPDVGFVQTPQSFYNADLFQFNLHAEDNIPNEQDYFFREVNVGRNHSNSAIYAGSNTIISRQALEAVGGIRVGTITEDFATGIDIQAAGYATYAIDTVLAHGLAPTDFTSLVKQRQRWARGCIQVLRGRRFRKQRMPLHMRASYFSSFLYWWSFLRRFIYILSPIVFAVFGILVVNCSPWQLLFIWLPFHLLYNSVLKVMSGGIWNSRWSNITDTVLFPYLIVPVVAEAFGVHLKRFAVTPKSTVYAKNSEWTYGLPHLLLMAFSVVAMVLCVRDLTQSDNFGGLVILYWLLVNFFSLLLAVICVSGRINYDREEHFAVKLPVTLSGHHWSIDAEVDDICESELSVVLPELIFLPNRQAFTAELEDGNYHARVAVTTRRVTQEGAGWRYHLTVLGASNEDRGQYCQLVFDRDHMFPSHIQSGLIKDLWSLGKGYLTQRRPVGGRSPLIPADAVLLTVEGLEVRLTSYNFDYLTIKDTPDLADEFTLVGGDGFRLDCRRASGTPHDRDVTYKIVEIYDSRVGDHRPAADPDLVAASAGGKREGHGGHLPHASRGGDRTRGDARSQAVNRERSHSAGGDGDVDQRWRNVLPQPDDSVATRLPPFHLFHKAGE